jgi:hypothetical protein
MIDQQSTNRYLACFESVPDLGVRA